MIDSADVFRDLVDILQKSEECTLPEKRQKFRIEVTASLSEFIQTLIGRIQIFSNGGWRKVEGGWNELRMKVATQEREERRQELSAPASQEEVMANLMWMAERGEEEDLDLLRQLQRHPSYTSDETQRLLNIAVQRISERVDDPDYIFEQGEAAYQQHKEAWDRLYVGQFIAIYRGAVVDADADESKLIDRIMQKQQEEGPFRAYIVQIDAPVLNVKGPRVKRTGQKRSNKE